MNVQSSNRYKTLSETMQEKFQRKKCPKFNDCIHIVTHDFFKGVCSSNKYLACLHYARAMDEAETPMVWLQKNAIATSTPITE